MMFVLTIFFIVSSFPYSKPSLIDNILNPLSNIPNPSNSSNDTSITGFLQPKCYGDLGCFSALTFFDVFNNVNVVFPENPENMNVTFNLFTCNNTESPIVFNYTADDESIKTSTFKADLKTKIITHGYRDRYNEYAWMGAMKNYTLNYSCAFNVIGVDWSKAADSINYFESAANTRVVGAMVAHFMNRLKNATNCTLDNFHLIGHSLGAHVCGFAGERIRNPKVNHITGLDPAGPGFWLNESNTRLDPTDADFVDNIHTNGGAFGLLDPIGHLDFYPNGGSLQPGCGVTEGFESILTNGTQGFTDALGCNHFRAFQLPTALSSTIDSGNACQLIGYKCQSYKDFHNGKCADCGSNNELCKPLEFMFDFWENSNNYKVNETQPPNKFFIKTSAKTPFCLFHYQIVVYISENSSSTTGQILISINGLNVTLNQQLFPGFKPGQKYTSLLTTSKILGSVFDAEVKWNPTLSVINPCIRIEKIAINAMSFINESDRNNNSVQLCPHSDQQISSENSIQFQYCNNASI